METFNTTPLVEILNSNCLLQVMRHFPNFVRWQKETGRKGRTEKVPYSLKTGWKAWPTNPAHWCPFADNWVPFLYNQLGFVLTRDCYLICIDLDNKEDNPALYDLHRRIMDDFKDCYVEYSPSGGVGIPGVSVHIWMRGTLVENGYKFKALGVEFYCNLRYMTLTWRTISNNPLPEGSERVNKWIAECQRLTGKPVEPVQRESRGTKATVGCGCVENGYPTITTLRHSPLTESDYWICRTAAEAKNGHKFKELWLGHWYGKYPSQSEADQGLINIISWYTNDKVQVARIYLHSDLSWNLTQRHSVQYLWDTIDTAFASELRKKSVYATSGPLVGGK